MCECHILGVGMAKFNGWITYKVNRKERTCGSSSFLHKILICVFSFIRIISKDLVEAADPLY